MWRPCVRTSVHILQLSSQSHFATWPGPFISAVSYPGRADVLHFRLFIIIIIKKVVLQGWEKANNTLISSKTPAHNSNPLNERSGRENSKRPKEGEQLG